MHSLIVIGGGIALLAAFLLFGHAWSDSPARLAYAAASFLPLWLVLCLLNLGIGVSQAGYSMRDEWPVALIVFALPALVAAAVIVCGHR